MKGLLVLDCILAAIYIGLVVAHFWFLKHKKTLVYVAMGYYILFLIYNSIRLYTSKKMNAIKAMKKKYQL